MSPSELWRRIVFLLKASALAKSDPALLSKTDPVVCC